ncbi:MAG: hypothetical protein LAO09_22945, partial [Acidobacteriia bacterium]|nr:hypothetical protein [Terriglobia bacterium]
LMVLYLALGFLEIREFFWFAILFANICFFLTPVGLSWFERGQFSVFVGTSFLMLVVGLLRKNPVWVVIAALIAFIKWTAFPVLAIFLSVYLLNSRNIKELKHSIFIILVFSLPILLMTFLPILFISGPAVTRTRSSGDRWSQVLALGLKVQGGTPARQPLGSRRYRLPL